jgi:serine/threonine-protein kinase
MPDATPNRPCADRDLLFGILALEMDFISRDALIAAMHAWVQDKAKPLGQILVEQGALQSRKRDLLESLVEAHLDMHGGEVEKSLAALDVPDPVRQELHSLNDSDVEASIARLSTHSEHGEPRTGLSTMPMKPAAGLRYQVLRPHGKGGIGIVFVALDQELNREVALKEIQDQHASDEGSRSRFLREAEITGGLEHPGIVPVYGLGQYMDGRPFYAMRFIQGETLKDAIKHYHQTPSRSPELELRGLPTRFVAVCNTIAYAHSRGVLHRDLKPSNIMLGKYGETLVVDWGMAKPKIRGPEPGDPSQSRSARDGFPEPSLIPLLADTIETQAGAAMGTPAYMSPEQAFGRLDQLGPTSDIYSLGATLFTLLTGHSPIVGTDKAEVLRKAQRGQWLAPCQVKPNVPPALDAICRKAMALRPEHRYATSLELAADVERWLADEPVAAYPEPFRLRAGRWLRRHQTLVTGMVPALVVGLLLLGTCVAAAWYCNRLEKDLASILSQDVTSMRAAQDLEIRVRQLRFRSFLDLIDPSPARQLAIREAQERFEESLRLERFTVALHTHNDPGTNPGYRFG